MSLAPGLRVRLFSRKLLRVLRKIPGQSRDSLCALNEIFSPDFVEGIGLRVMRAPVIGRLLHGEEGRHAGFAERHMIAAVGLPHRELFEADFVQRSGYLVHRLADVIALLQRKRFYLPCASIMDYYALDPVELSGVRADVVPRSDRPLLLAGKQDEAQ